jgi:hypothetical protein
MTMGKNAPIKQYSNTICCQFSLKPNAFLQATGGLGEETNNSEGVEKAANLGTQLLARAAVAGTESEIC